MANYVNLSQSIAIGMVCVGVILDALIISDLLDMRDAYIVFIIMGLSWLGVILNDVSDYSNSRIIYLKSSSSTGAKDDQCYRNKETTMIYAGRGKV
jgi:hypothetical protein